ncbi:phage scaffolding protein [Alkalihalobacillus trypoxylicola]|uniref:Scaffolding protein n=1 Tax=Alkalihalobacillus trypoxylicola TaxID=519424 RepID=A0A161PHA9_9BACI|nr:phage scaffolding protein [Alkalihalobacillus trypoxylicola]KYG28173.1 hypothetical protein AZF04_09730 [Alkalihalobacillus trypoxylicola]
MKREFLKGLGLEDEVIDKVMAEHGSTVNKTKDDLQSVTTERDNLKGQLTDRDKQLETLKSKATGNEELLQQIDQLKQDNKEAADDWKAQLDKQSFDFALDKALTSAKVRNSKAAKALLDVENIKLDGDKLTGLDDQLTALKESDGYLFAEEGAPGKWTNGKHHSGGGITVDDFKKLSYAGRIKLKKDNPTKYNELAGK